MNDTVSVYNGTKPTVVSTVIWQQVLANIKTGKYKPAIKRIRDIKDAEKYRVSKTKLPAVTFSGTFKKKRKKENIEEPTGFIIPDLDHIPDVEKTFSILKKDRHVWFMFRSPSGAGIKCGIRSRGIRNDDDVKEQFAAVQAYFSQAYGIEIDPACKDISRLTFVSNDKDLYICRHPRYFDVAKFAPTEKEQPPRPPRVPVRSGNNGWRAVYGSKVLASCCERIASSQPGEQHITRLQMGRLVGGYIASGFIDGPEALEAIEDAVRSSGAKDHKAAMASLLSGIEFGQCSPIYVEERESRPPPPSHGEPPPPTIYQGEQRDTLPQTETQKTASLEDFNVLEKKEVPPIEWLVKGFLAHGTTILAASPKTGKSTLALGLCVAVGMGGKAFGKIDVVKGQSLYISLDDPSERRLQDRLRKMLGYQTWPSDAFYSLDFKRADEGGIIELDQILADRPKISLVVVDTLMRFLSSKPSAQNAYEHDLTRLGPLVQLAAKHRICLLAIHHLTKAKHEDPFDAISGSMGVQGSVDDLLLMERDKDRGFKLHTRGRSLEDRTYIMTRDPLAYSWTLEDGDINLTNSDSKQAVFVAMYKKPDAVLKTAEIVELSGCPASSARWALGELVKDELVVKVRRGQYTCAREPGC